MSVSLAPIYNGWQGFSIAGLPLSGGLLSTYLAGTSTPAATYTDNTGGTPNSNPIVLDAAGLPPNEIWITDGTSYKFILTDALGLNSRTYDNLAGVGSGSSSFAADLANTSNTAKGDALVGVHRTEANAVGRTLHFYIQHSKLLVANYCDPTSDTPSQVAAALALAITDAKAGGKALEFDPGATYTTNAETAFLGANALRGLRFWGNGATLFRSSGAGPVASLDSAGATNRCDDIEFVDFRLKGSATATYGLYTRGLVRSRVHSLRAVDVATAGYKVDWSVCTNFKDLIMSDNVDTFTVIGTKGLIVDQSQAGNYTSDCIFENMMFEGTTAISDVGIELASGGLTNVFRNGTCESLLRGFRYLSTSGGVDNTLEGMDFESNTDYDVLASGNGLTLQDCNIQSSGVATGNLVIASTARNTTLRGGFCRWAAIDPSSLGTRFFGTKVSDNAAVGISGATSFSSPAAGTFQAYGVIKVNGSHVPTSNYPDVYAAPGTWTPAFASAGGGTQGAVTSAVGAYSLVGKLCFLSGSMSIAKGTLAAGSVSVTGLPFAAHATANSPQYVNPSEWESITLGAGYTTLSLRILSSGTVAAALKSGTAVASAVVNVADFPDPMVLKFSGTYEIT